MTVVFPDSRNLLLCPFESLRGNPLAGLVVDSHAERYIPDSPLDEPSEEKPVKRTANSTPAHGIDEGCGQQGIGAVSRDGIAKVGLLEGEGGTAIAAVKADQETVPIDPFRDRLVYAFGLRLEDLAAGPNALPALRSDFGLDQTRHIVVRQRKIAEQLPCPLARDSDLASGGYYGRLGHGELAIVEPGHQARMRRGDAFPWVRGSDHQIPWLYQSKERWPLGCWRARSLAMPRGQSNRGVREPRQHTPDLPRSNR